MKLVYNYDAWISVNKLYYLRQSQYGKQLTVEARNLRARVINDTIEQMHDRDFAKCLPMNVCIKFYGGWYGKNTAPKRKDIDNPLKFIIDSIFKAFDMDDRYIFNLCVHKIESEETKCEVIIENCN